MTKQDALRLMPLVAVKPENRELLNDMAAALMAAPLHDWRAPEAKAYAMHYGV